MAEVSTYLGDSDRGMSDINVGGLATNSAAGLALPGSCTYPRPARLAIGAAMGGRGSSSASSSGGWAGSARSSRRCRTARPSRSRRSAWSRSSRMPGCGRAAPSPRPSARTRAGGWPCSAWCSRRRARHCSSSSVRRAPDAVARDRRCDQWGRRPSPRSSPVGERTGHDTQIGVAYALVYPVAMITKIVIAQVLAGLG